MTIAVRFLARYQIATGAISLLWLLSRSLSNPSHWLVGLLVMAALSVLAGLLLYRNALGAWGLTYLNLGSQVFGFQTPLVSFWVTHGVSLGITGSFERHESFASSLFTGRLGMQVLESTCNVSAGVAGQGFSTYSVSLNFLALGLFVFAVLQRRKRIECDVSGPLDEHQGSSC